MAQTMHRLMIAVLEIVLVLWTSGLSSRCVVVCGSRSLAPLVRRPPSLTKQGPFEEVYQLGETVTIPCQANGSPAPSYRWTKDDRDLEPDAVRYSTVEDHGTLTIRETSADDVGVYQCYASNRYGVAVSVRTRLTMAVLDPFPSVHSPKSHRIPVGRPLTLHCHPPANYPPSQVYWVEGRKQEKLKAIELSDRISLDPAGNLHFANLLPEDDRGGITYVCVVHNTVLRSLVQGDDQLIEPQKTAGPSRQEPPRIVVSPAIPELALKGQTKRLRCFFSGLPTPRVAWRRADNQMSDRAKLLSYGQELVLPDVEFDDAGRYHCDGANTAGNSTKEVVLIVESQPHWRNGRPPDDVVASEEDDVTISCHVNGVPKPAITWLINGIPVEGNNRMKIGSDFFKIDNLTESDTQVVQCNASNSHGYLFANVFISVQAEPPSFVETPPKEIRLSIGQSVVLRCRAFGAPKPLIEWKRGRHLKNAVPFTSDDDDGGRFEVMENGDLSIKDARDEDEDVYFCRISNKFGSDDSSTKLLVRDRTVIANFPEDQTVVEGTEIVVFVCNASTDPAERKKLAVEWSKDGTIIVPGRGGGGGGGRDDAKMTVADQGQQLTVRDVRVADTGQYTCRATNGLDVDSRSIRLTVKGAPNPPTNVRLIGDCSSKFADVSWNPGSDNNDPVVEYIVYFNTNYADPGKYEEWTRLNATSRPSARIALNPWTAYTFVVVAVNGVGRSERSEATADRCETAPVRPHRNPRRVCTDSRNPGQLVIVWEPMLRMEHNGPGFHYLVTYRSLGSASQVTEVKRQVSDWRQSEMVVKDQAGFQEYEISVQAANNVGVAQVPLERFIGYSGEDVPLDRPRNFQLIKDSLNDTSAVFTWEPVHEDRKSVRGFFHGYQTDRLGDGGGSSSSGVRSDDQRSVAKEMTAEAAVVEILTNRLWPYSTITAGVLVLSGTKQGQLSDAIEFTTPEGAPDVVPAFWVSERGSHHLKLSWSAPFEINGVLRGYGIAYKEASSAVDLWKQTYSTYPDITYRKLHDLKSDTVYLVTIWAETNSRRGQELTIEEETVSEDVPDKPVIETLDAGYDYVNVSWRSSEDEEPRSPGSDFVVEYRPVGSDDWKQSPRERQHNWLNVTNLEPGEIYEFRVVALNRKGDAMKSEILLTRISVKQEPVVQSSKSRGWIAVFVCLLIISGCAVLSYFVIKRNRGGIYPVYKREKLNGHDRKNDKEPFGEYVRTESTTNARPRSRTSLESSSSQSQEEATDSLGIYDDAASAKFNDDGSIATDRPTAAAVAPAAAAEGTSRGAAEQEVAGGRSV